LLLVLRLLVLRLLRLQALLRPLALLLVLLRRHMLPRACC
jgi:hypothetical protein